MNWRHSFEKNDVNLLYDYEKSIEIVWKKKWKKKSI